MFCDGNFISYNLRMIQEYFQSKIGRKIRIFSLGRKNHILVKNKECTCTHSSELVANLCSSIWATNRGGIHF